MLNNQMVYINGDDGYNNRANNSDGNNSDHILTIKEYDN